MEIKCKKCGEVKDISMFNNDRYAKSGKKNSCKACCIEATRAWQRMNPEKAKSINTSWYKKDKKRIAVKNKKWYEAHKQEVLASDKRYMSNPENKEKIRAAWRRNFSDHPERWAQRRAKKRCAIVKWANQFILREAYDLARRRSKVTGINWHVDHIVPLVHPLVCGLHCDDNIQVIPARHNLEKSNFHWPDMP